MAQVLHNDFTEIEFTEEEEREIGASFTERQLQLLQNFRARAAGEVLNLVFEAGPEQDKSIREHAYQRGRMDVVGEVISFVADARQRPAPSADSSND